ncbi:MAG: phosphoglycolate phosphatase [Pseudoxanthomonas suwonensis]|nr:phosphoglycolate phosphatase [Pseudoxanthomonas suwonensis]
MKFPRVVLFDLDGTLLDSAPDMHAAANIMRAEHGLPPLPLVEFRDHVSRGGRAMLEVSFPLLDEERRMAMLPRFLDLYERDLTRHGGPFAGVPALLDAMEADGTRWGIVTNKPEYLARQLLPLLGWDTRCAILIGGDTLAERKPHPLPLLHSAEVLGVVPEDCVYVGDDRRDIDAARAAKMRSIIALWGYRLPHDDPGEWGGDVQVASADALLDPARWP